MARFIGLERLPRYAKKRVQIQIGSVTYLFPRAQFQLERKYLTISHHIQADLIS